MGFTGRKTMVMNSLLLIIMLGVDIGMKCYQWVSEFCIEVGQSCIQYNNQSNFENNKYIYIYL